MNAIRSAVAAFAFLISTAFSLGAESVTLADAKVEGSAIYRIDGSFEVAADRAGVWAVLSGYDALQGVVSSMLESRVQSRQGGLVTVRQKARGRFLFFRKTIHLVLEIAEQPLAALEFEDVSGASFRLYRGSWRLSDVEGGVRVDYRLDVSSSDLAPAFLEKRLFEANALGLLRELKAEIVRRAKKAAS